MNIFLLQRFTVYGQSMHPTLNQGDDVLVLRWFFKLKVGDIIAIKVNGKEMIKRIQKTHGRSIFVQGDNEKMSTDSRKFGWIKNKEIIGKVIWY